MKKTLLLVPVALLLASCGGSKPTSGKELLLGKTFKCPTTIIEKTDEIVSWLNQNKDKIIWYEDGANEESNYARIEYYDGKLKSNRLTKPDQVNVDSIYEKMYDKLKDDSVKFFEVFNAMEIDFDKNGTGNFRIVDPEDEQRKVKMSGPITFTDLEGYNHGEGVNFSGSITEVDKEESTPITGTFAIKNWEDNKISQTIVTLAVNEEETRNYAEFKFPIAGNEDEDFSIGALINFLPANE